MGPGWEEGGGVDDRAAGRAGADRLIEGVYVVDAVKGAVCSVS